jgi:hypothetical protein
MNTPFLNAATSTPPEITDGDDARAHNLALRALGLLTPDRRLTARAYLSGAFDGRDVPVLPTFARFRAFATRLQDEIASEFGHTDPARYERLARLARRAAEAARLRAAVARELAWLVPAANEARAELDPLIFSWRSARRLTTITRLSLEVDRLWPAIERLGDAVGRRRVAAGLLDLAVLEQPVPMLSHPPRGARNWPTRALELLGAGDWSAFVDLAVAYAAALPAPAVDFAPRAGVGVGPTAAAVTPSIPS